MANLISFGCSYTYGYGLADCPNREAGPSKFAWPQLVSDKLGMPSINLSKPAAGNAEIFDKVLRYKFVEDDICMILWSHFVRYDQCKITENYEPVRKWSGVTKDEVDSMIGPWNAYKNYMTMHHCSLYLNSIGVKSVSAIAFIPDYIKFPKPDFLRINNLIELPNDYVVDNVPDGHPGPKTQQVIAKSMIEGLNNVIR